MTTQDNNSNHKLQRYFQVALLCAIQNRNRMSARMSAFGCEAKSNHRASMPKNPSAYWQLVSRLPLTPRKSLQTRRSQVQILSPPPSETRASRTRGPCSLHTDLHIRNKIDVNSTYSWLGIHAGRYQARALNSSLVNLCARRFPLAGPRKSPLQNPNLKRAFGLIRLVGKGGGVSVQGIAREP